MAGRNSRLRDAEFCKALAECYVTGASKKDIAAEFGCSESSVMTWTRDPRVQAHITRLTRERVNRITKKIDSVIEGRLAHADDWRIEELLKARKEYLERAVPKDVSTDEGSTINEISEAMDQKPELAKQLRELIGD